MKSKILLILAILSFMFMDSKASHVMGVDLTYECLGPGQYRVRLQAYRDCNGVSMSNTVSIGVRSAQCNVNTSVTLNQVGPALDVTPLCPSATSRCGSGGTYGIQKYIYEGILNIPPNCGTDWILSWSLCCRNNAITTLTSPGNEGTYVETELNNTLSPCNNSPVFLNDPVPFYCANQVSNYNHGVVDADGDSLFFSLLPALDAAANDPVAYRAGFSPLQPLSTTGPFTLNSQNGDISFTANQRQIGVVKVAVDEYRNGVRIGRVVRDMQFIIENCNNNLPTATGFNGTTNYTTTILACSNACFTINSADADAANVVTMVYNDAIPGATFTISSGNRPTGTFCWAPTPADTGVYRFTIQVRDNACQIYGTNTYSYTVRVLPSNDPPANAGPDVILCQGQSTTLSATAGPGATFTWSNGTSTQNGATWNVSPANTTLYTVSATYPNGCVKTDNVLVTRVPRPSISAYPPVITVCSPTDSAQLNASSNTGVTYQWSPTTGMPCPTCQNPQVAPGATTTYSVTAFDVNNCPSDPATIQVILNNPPPTQSCSVIYGTVNGTGNGTQSNPASLAGALALAQCNNAHVKLGIGNYPIDFPITNIGSNTTIEGGFDPALNWQKSSLAGATTISRSTLNLEGTGQNKRLVAVYLSNASYVRFQDITFQNANAPAISGGDVYGYSNYVFHISNSSNYDFVRCQILGGNASSGQSGVNGTPGIAGANGVAGSGGSCNGGSCTFGSGDPGGAGGRGGNGAGGAAGGAGGAAANGTANNGTAGSPATGLNGGGGGGGGAGMDECNTNVSSGAAGGSSSQGAGGNGGGGGNSGDPGGTGANGVAGLAGANGTNGSPGSAGSFIGGFYNAGGLGTNGTNGVGGSGGGGGGGGGRQQCTFCDNGPGNGGGGGGGGGSAGTFGTGGYGGGSSFAVFLNNNGANTNFIDCNIVSGLLGNGGAGGAGGAGGLGGAGGAGASVCTSEIGRGGNGGLGGRGGNGGNGGSGADGISGIVYLNSGTAPITSITNFNLAAQPVINTDNISCTFTNNNLSATSSGTWDAGSGASNPTSTGVTHTTQYTTVGRKNIQYASNVYTGFVFIAIDQGSFIPQIQTTATRIGTTDSFWICAGNTANFIANIASADTFDWNFRGATTPSLFFGSGLPFKNLNNLAFNTPGTYMVTLRIKTDCCGWSPYDTIFMIVEEQPTLAIAGNTYFCPGDSALINLSGATSYLWAPTNFLTFLNPINSNVVANPPVSTTYFVTGFSPRGFCRVDTSLNIQVQPPPSLSFATTPATCGANGTITLTVTPTSTYSYAWSANASGQVTNTLTNLASGNYLVTVTETVSGCTAEGNAFVTTNGGVQAFIDSTVNVRCYGQSNGFARAVGIGGTPPYTYSWSNNVALNNRNNANLAAGTYTVTVRDFNNCTASYQTIIAQPDSLVIQFLDTIPASCFNSCDGRALVDAFGGNQNHLFTWSNGQIDTLWGINLCRGTYTVTVSDELGCSAVGTINIPAPPQLIADTISTTPPTCFGRNDGEIIVGVVGGVYPYTYIWPTNPTNIDSIGENLYANTYPVIVEDDNGCRDTTLAILSERPRLTLSLTSVDTVLCNGDNNGGLTVSAAGGNGGYQFQINGGALQSSNQFTGLIAGTYTVNVVDSRGCDTTLQVVVPEPSLLNLTLVQSRNLRCNASNDGMIRVSASGGNGNYEYTINGVAFQTIDSFLNLAAGNYIVGVRDRKNCIDTVWVTLTQPAVLDLTQVSVTSPTCNTGSDGSLEVSASGGVLPYRYILNYQLPGQAGGLFNSQNGGAKSLMVIDANGCVDSITVTVPAPPPTATLDSAVIDVSCFGFSDGSIDLTVTGTVPPYSFQWSNGELTEDISSIPAGKYFVIVTDGAGCVVGGLDSIEIRQPTQITITPTIQAVSCFNGSNGCINITVSGGNPGYTFVWSNGETSQNVCNLVAGTYSVTVFDSRGCSAVLSNIIMTQPTAIALSASTTLVTCPDRTDGSIDLSVTGGTSPYRYNWNGGATSQDLSNLAVGPYTVVVTDFNNCTANLTVNVAAITELQINPEVRNVFCHPLRNGAVISTPSGGTGPYQFVWNDGSRESFISGLAEGTYSVTVRDFNGCIKDSTFTITNDSAFTMVALPRDTTIGLGEEVQLSLFTDGDNPSEITWFPPNSLTCTDCVSPISSTTASIIYRVSVVSDSGCVAKDSVIIRVDPTYTLYVPNAFTPNGDGNNDFFEIFGKKSTWKQLEFNIFNRWGEKVFESNDLNFAWDGKYRGEAQPPQVYVYELVLTYINGYTAPKQKGSITLIR